MEKEMIFLFQLLDIVWEGKKSSMHFGKSINLLNKWCLFKSICSVVIRYSKI